MMEKIYVNIDNVADLQMEKTNCVMVLGYFDGVHLGHQEVLNTAKKLACQKKLKLSVMSFFPHPKSVLNKESNNFYLEPIENRMEKLEKLKVDTFYIVEFNEQFSKITPDEFIRNYVIGLGAKQIVCGFDYKYGYKASGNTETLKMYREMGIGVTVISEQKDGEVKISSTAIRNCLQNGEVHHIPRYLGSHYFIKYGHDCGVLEHYKLPLIGKYEAMLEFEHVSIVSFVTIDEIKKLHFDCDVSHTKQPFKVYWLKKVG